MFNSDQLPGRPFVGAFTSSDATALAEADARILLYEAGLLTPIVLTADEQVLITDIFIHKAGTTSVRIFDGANVTVAAGETIIFIQSTTSTVPYIFSLRVPHYCQVGTYPKVITSAAILTDIMIRGTIRSPNNN